MASKNFDWIKHDQSEANIVFAIPVNSSFYAVNFPSFLRFITAPVKRSNVDFLSHLPFGVKYVVNNISETFFIIFASNVITCVVQM